MAPIDIPISHHGVRWIRRGPTAILISFVAERELGRTDLWG
jgi:hypothetical protein